MDAVHLPASGGLGRFTCGSQDIGNLTVTEGKNSSVFSANGRQRCMLIASSFEIFAKIV
jgi:hypothetical protein